MKITTIYITPKQKQEESICTTRQMTEEEKEKYNCIQPQQVKMHHKIYTFERKNTYQKYDIPTEHIVDLCEKYGIDKDGLMNIATELNCTTDQVKYLIKCRKIKQRLGEVV